MVPQHVLTSFGLDGEPRLLAGGEGRTYRIGDVIVRRENQDELPGATFAADLFSNIEESPEFRVSRPVRSGDGGWLVDGWSAWTCVDGRPAEAGDAPSMVRAVEAFHSAVAGVPRSAQIGTRPLPYDRADLGAFEELPDEIDARVRPTLASLDALRRPLEGFTDQVIHGDLNAENVLIAPGQPPAIIDLAPYWRPPEFALAVAAYWMCAYDGHVGAFAAFEQVREFDQFLLRALIRTLLIMEGFGEAERLSEYDRSIDIVRARLTASRERQ